MGALLSLFKSKKKIELCLVGLENSGKTTLLNVLSVGAPLETMPTIGLVVKMFQKEGVTMKLWDLGGQARFRAEWNRYTQGCDCIVFCVDAHDYGRVATSKQELHKLLEDNSLNGLPVLIALNKIDLDPHMSQEEAVRDLELSNLVNNPWVVSPISALKKQNIDEVVNWLVKHSHK